MRLNLSDNILRSPDGFGNINYSSPAGAPAPFINVAGARNGLSVDPQQFIVLGNVAGDVGNEAKLLNSREIPFNGHSLSFTDLLEGVGVVSKVNFWDFAGLPMNIIQNGDGSFSEGNLGSFFALTPANWGESYADPNAPGGVSTMDRWTMSYRLDANGQGATGMPDAVLNFGYNITPSGARVSPNDGSWRLGFETNFFGDINGVIGLDFEFHIPEVTLFDGTIQRTVSYYVDKGTGDTLEQHTTEAVSFLTIGHSQVEWAHLETINNIGARLTLYTDFSGTTAGDIYFFDPSTTNISNFQGTGTQFGWTPDFVNHPKDFMFLDGSDNFWTNQSSDIAKPGGQGLTIVGQITASLTDIDQSAQLQVWSTTRGFLPPRMTTTQKNAIASPAAGLLVYDTILNKLSLRTAAAWEIVTSV